MGMPLASSQRFAVSVLLPRCVTQWELAMIGWLVTSRTPMVGQPQPRSTMGTDELAKRRPRRSEATSFPLVRAFLLIVGGGSVLAALFAVGGLVQLDSLLVISKTIFNIITGLKQIAGGFGLLLLGLAQALGLFAMSLAAMIAVLAVASGLLRLLAHALPGLGSVWKLLAHALNAIVGLLGFPHPLAHQPRRESRAPVPLTTRHRVRAEVRMRTAG
jgi:hypothetical protein